MLSIHFYAETLVSATGKLPFLLGDYAWNLRYIFSFQVIFSEMWGGSVPLPIRRQKRHFACLVLLFSKVINRS